MSETPSLSSREKVEKALGILGYSHDRRTLAVLRAMLNAQSSLQRPVDSAEVFNGLLQAEPGTSVTQTWVRKVLEALVDIQMVMPESDSLRKKRFSADANTIVTGLEGLKYATSARLEAQRRSLQEELSLLSTIDFGHIAGSLARRAKNNVEQPRSKLLKGIEAYRNITNMEVYGRAGAGDVLRVARLWLRPFMSTVLDAIDEMLSAVERGAELLYCVTADILRQDDLLASGIPRTDLAHRFARVLSLREKKPRVDVRICNPNARTYHFSSLNDESMAILLSEDPLAATWVSRAFNPDLIKSAIESFDRTWEQSVSIFGSPQRLIERFPGSESGYLVSAMVASQKKTEGKVV